MGYHSILFLEAADLSAAKDAKQPAYFRDLNLDQVVAAATAGRDEYNLTPFFHVPLPSQEAIEYRQDVLQDLQDGGLMSPVVAFAAAMRQMRSAQHQAEGASYPRQKQRWFLEAVNIYCAAVSAITHELRRTELRSEGLQQLHETLSAYVASPPFDTLAGQARQLMLELAGIQYQVHLKDLRVAVDNVGTEADYGEQVARTFERFRQGPATEYEFKFRDYQTMNHVEAAILDRVALLNPETFGALERFSAEHAHYVDATVRDFDRDLQFYLAVRDLYTRMSDAGLPSCLPAIDEGRVLDCHGIYDLSLALRLKEQAGQLVLNDVQLSGPERILVVTGANQGGKTTFARTVGQLCYLANLGCPVPAAGARLPVFDQFFTHFEREENLQTLHSKLEDDLERVHAILKRATPRSLLIMNESFSSATLQDALFLGRQVMAKIVALDLLCVFVTFLDELSALGPQTVSMVSSVTVGDAARRTFRILRMRADGLAWAAALATKYGLDYAGVKRRIAP